MLDNWFQDLSTEEQQAVTTRIANEIRKRGLETPAILMLEMHRPLYGVASQALLAFSPFTAPLFGLQNVRDFSRLLGNREAMDLLIQKIESGTPDEGSPSEEVPCST